MKRNEKFINSICMTNLLSVKLLTAMRGHCSSVYNFVKGDKGVENNLGHNSGGDLF